jgi:hypothetical protein
MALLDGLTPAGDAAIGPGALLGIFIVGVFLAIAFWLRIKSARKRRSYRLSRELQFLAGRRSVSNQEEPARDMASQVVPIAEFGDATPRMEYFF